MANSFFLSVKGQKQGDFKGETGKNLTLIPILGFSYEVTVPRDPASGLPTGRRQHKPITVFKEWGVVSVQLFEALVTNETLTTVVIEEMRTDKSGKESVYMQIRLTNAIISQLEIDPQRQDDPPLWTNTEIERISFVFQKIEIENRVSKTTVQDDWEQRP
jgi:type VI secretion system secreted protein Hcp